MAGFGCPPRLYAILSKGIHELTEDECGRLFPLVKAGTKAILDEHISREKKEARIAETRAGIAAAKGALK
jgi:hypothetical protein